MNKNPSKQKIQLVQELLKTSAFDPGPIDGILGPKTRSALYQYQSGCAMLKDLLGTSDKGLFQQTAVTQAPKVTAPVNKNPSKQKIRLVQERLKTFGFDPGPIDGALGPKTRSALLKYQASHGLSNSGTLDEKTLVSLGVG
ncbi:MAG: peptidoglycan-binding domain-containing protein [Candidatus Binatia bacterium]